jgi:hypothetical protein
MKKFLFATAVSVMFGCMTVNASSFIDVQSRDWFYPYVEALVEVGIIDNSFDYYRPGDSLNRAEAVKVIVEAAGYEYVEPAVPTFRDVMPGIWYYKYVETAAAHGVVSGYADRPGYFGPGDNVTRGQFAKMGVISQNFEQIDVDAVSAPTFPDVSESRWSFVYVETAYLAGIFSGYDDGTFRPDNDINRAEMAKMIYGFMPDDQVGPLCLREGDDVEEGDSCCSGLVEYEGVCMDPYYIPVPTI